MKAHGSGRNVAAIIFTVLAAVSAIALGIIWRTGPQTAFAQAATGTPSPLPAATSVPGCWTTFVNPGNLFGEVKAISGTSAEDIWSVGMQNTQNNGGSAISIAHWDGTQWTPAVLPSLGVKFSRLNGVSALSPNDVWAVGSTGDPSAKPQHTLALHWDGQTWTPVLTPNATDNINDLLAVAAVSANNVWAVGYFEPSAVDIGAKEALLLHFDGEHWGRVSIPGIVPTAPNAGYSTLESISVISKDDIWVAGSGTKGFAPMTLHYDGSGWQMMPMPVLDGMLHGIFAVAPNDVWAVGHRQVSPQGALGTLTMHWNGSQWSVLPGLGSDSTPPNGIYWLNSVTASSANDVWAVGLLSYPQQPLIEHWDGATWQPVLSPVDAGSSSTALAAVTAIDGAIWMAGSNQGNYSPTLGTGGLVLRHTSSGCAASSPTASATPSVNPPVPIPGSRSRTFPETGKTVTGIFLDYWESHGGLAQQGYPISNVMGEVSDLDGKLYTVQYFERAVFEYHPENKAPYDVLLSQLGTFEYQRKYGAGGAPGQKPNNDKGSILFPQTGHRLGGKFLEYWQYHGGLPQQGYPISEEFTEVSPLNGISYTVQYFERAVFEYHPEYAGTPYEVLLSQLGRFQYARKYTGSGLLADFTVRSPIVVGQDVFWVDVRDHNMPQPHVSIYGYDLTQKREFPLVNRPETVFQLAGNSKGLYWVESGEIMGHDFAHGYDGIIVEANGQRYIGDGTEIAADGDTLYYTTKEYGGMGAPIDGPLMAHSLVNQQETKIADSAEKPVAGDGILLWTTLDSANVPELHLLNVGAGDKVDKVIARGEFSSYSVSGDLIVWSAWGESTDHDVHVYSVKAGGEQTRIPARAAVNPIIRGSKVVWTDWLNRLVAGDIGSGIRAYDLATGQASTVVDDSSTFVQAAAMTADGQVLYGDQDDPLNGGLRKLYIK